MTVLTSEEILASWLGEIDRELLVWARPDAFHFGPVRRGRDLGVFAHDRAIVFRSLGWDESNEV